MNQLDPLAKENLQWLHNSIAPPPGEQSSERVPDRNGIGGNLSNSKYRYGAKVTQIVDGGRSQFVSLQRDRCHIKDSNFTL
jgi:hypothetical protein